MTSAWNASGGGTVTSSRRKTTGSRKRGNVEIVSWVIWMVGNRGDDVGAPKKLAAAVKILREKIIHAERLAGLYGDAALDTPAIGEGLPLPFAIGKLIDEVPVEPLEHIKVRIAAILADGRPAVVGLRGIGHEVFAVAGVIDGMRPHVIQGGSKSMPIVYAQAGLQRVVIRIGRRFLVVDEQKRRKSGCARVPSRHGTVVNACTSEIRSSDFRLARLIDVTEAK